MAHLSPEQNEKLRKAMQRAIDDTYRTRLALASAMGVRPPAVSDFLNLKGGASLETAEAFAQRIARKPLEDVIGSRQLATVKAVTPDGRGRPAGFPVDAETRRKAAVLLRQPPQNFSAEAIEIGLDSVVMNSAEEAKNPAAVAELARMAILGVAANLPRMPSDAPPLGTRRSRKTGR